MEENPKYIVIDLFCGAGGVTTGFEQAIDEHGNKIAKVIACVNHDELAIKSHYQNHPDVQHFTEDIRTLDITDLVTHVLLTQFKYPNAKLILWASLECTNFSKAKGGQARDNDSRTLADSLFRYIDAMNIDYVMIENVVEFMSWGPLDEKGKPISMCSGEDYERWKKEVCDRGYVTEWKQMNSADYGAHTSRNRLFGVFARPDLPIIWPEPTHAKKPDGLKKRWVAVKDKLDLLDEGKSIFNRKKPLVDNTLERIYAGLIKHVAGDSQKNFIAKYYSGRPAGKVISINGPAGTIKTKDGQSIVTVKNFVTYYNSKNAKTGEQKGLSSIDDPFRTITTQNRAAIAFLVDYHGTGDNTSNIDNPKNTILAADIHSKVHVKWIDSSFITSSNYKGSQTSPEDPIGVITANRKHHYIVNPSWIKGSSSDSNKPCPVIIARQDKAPLYLITTERASMFSIPIYEDDSEIMIKIKEFMMIYGIADIKMRMLKVIELLKIQGFPENYKLMGKQRDQKKFIGNSVVPSVVKAWIESLNQYSQNEIYAQRAWDACSYSVHTRDSIEKF